MEIYEIIKSIGSGSFGQVYLAKHKREDKFYVIKKINTKDLQTKDIENTEQEVKLLQKLRHTNIVAYKDSYLDQDQYLNIVMIFCEGGDMHNKIKNMRSKNFPENQILDWFAQMALALYYLHDKKILHRDLKTQNIFLKHGRVRLGDFGIAKVLDSTKEFANTCIGTPYYMSPELFKYKPYSYKSDIWALGCIVYEMCNLRRPFEAQSIQGLAGKILKGSYSSIVSTYSKQLRDLISKMLNINPKERPTILDILHKPIVKKRVIQYMAEIFSGNYPEANMPNDVDDIVLDSLREQAEKLGIMNAIQEYMNGGEIKSQIHAVIEVLKGIFECERDGKGLLKMKKKQDLEEQSMKRIEQEMLECGRDRKNMKEAPPKLLMNIECKELKNIKEEKRKHKILLKQEEEEKKKIEAELTKLQMKENLRKNHLKDKEKERINRSDSKKHLSQENLRRGPIRAEELKPTEYIKQDPKQMLKDEIANKYRLKRSDSKESKVNSSSNVTSNGNINNKIKNDVSIDLIKLDDKSTKNSNAKNIKEGIHSSDRVLKQDIDTNVKKGPNQLFKDNITEEGKQIRKLSNENNTNNNSNQVDNAQSNMSISHERKKFIDMREKVLYEKEKKRREEQEKVEKALQAIRKENLEARKVAVEKKNAQYRPSDDLVSVIPLTENKTYEKKNSFTNLNTNSDGMSGSNDITSNVFIDNKEDNNNTALNNAIYQNEERKDEKNAHKKQFKITEDYEMYEEEEEASEENEIIQEEENEDENGEDLHKIQEKIMKAKEKLTEKTIKITELKQSLKHTKKLEKSIIKKTQTYQFNIDSPIDDEDDEESIDNDTSEEEDDSTEETMNTQQDDDIQEKKVYNNPQYQKLQDMIKLLRHRCETRIGLALFDKAYKFIQDKMNTMKCDDMRKYLIEMLGEENIGFWHIIDRILLLEDISKKLIENQSNFFFLGNEKAPFRISI